MDTLGDNWAMMLTPIVVTVLGGLISSALTLSATIRSTVQHAMPGLGRSASSLQMWL